MMLEYISQPLKQSLKLPSSLFHRQHTTTPFPYTTLFRSPCARYLPAPAPDLQRPVPKERLLGVARGVGASRQPALQIASGQDRKSTRLNSSHLVNSYAVFCLKKKKK